MCAGILKYSGLFGVSLLCWVSGVAVALDATADGLALNNGTMGAAEIYSSYIILNNNCL